MHQAAAQHRMTAIEQLAAMPSFAMETFNGPKRIDGSGADGTRALPKMFGSKVSTALAPRRPAGSRCSPAPHLAPPRPLSRAQL